MHMTHNRILAALLAMVCSMAAVAQTARPLTRIVPFSAGDAIAQPARGLALAVSNSGRNAFMSDLPALSEAGVSGTFAVHVAAAVQADGLVMQALKINLD